MAQTVSHNVPKLSSVAIETAGCVKMEHYTRDYGFEMYANFCVNWTKGSCNNGPKTADFVPKLHFSPFIA